MKNSVMRVYFTRKDIDNGVRGSCGQCPIALAISRKRKRAVRVQEGCVYIGPNFKMWHNGQGVYQFIRMFDTGKPVKPFWATFTRSV